MKTNHSLALKTQVRSILNKLVLGIFSLCLVSLPYVAAFAGPPDNDTTNDLQYKHHEPAAGIVVFSFSNKQK